MTDELPVAVVAVEPTPSVDEQIGLEATNDNSPHISLIADIKVIGESIEKTVVDAIEVVTE